MNLKAFLSNPHTSWAAAIYGIAYLVTALGPIWMPHYADQFAKTGDVIQKIAVIYGLVSAGDASKSITKEDAGTQFLRREEVRPEAKL